MSKREINRLPPNALTATYAPGRHADGGGLYLVVDKSGARRWAFLFRWDGRLKEMGLGGATSVGLAKARTKATEARGWLDDGLNPIEAAKAEKVPTFGEMADQVVTALSPQWRNVKHRAQWSMTLKEHAQPLRARKVNEITTTHVLDVLKPLVATKPETASRLRGRIERVLDAARAKGFIRPPWENPARWRGNLEHLLPARAKLSRGHHKAMPFEDLPAFMADLRARDAMAASALEFAILTAARTSEVLEATWAEIDLKAKTWTVPAGRTKAGREHRVPLSTAAVKLLEGLAGARTGKLIFPGPAKRGAPRGAPERPLSTNAMAALLERMDCDATVHGFRSSFRDWAGEVSAFPREIAEQALAHVVGDDTERAYRRGDALEKRRKLMQAWATYCEPRTSSNVRRLERRA